MAGPYRGDPALSQVPPESAAAARTRGRFAPSPSGALHFGSVVAAVGSYLQARAQGGEWLVRIENIDPDREVPGSEGEILRELERLGLEWDGPVVSQRTRRDAYRAAMEDLRRRDLVYRCRCSRRVAGPGPYSGTCRDLTLPPETPGTWRLRVPDTALAIEDAVQGRFVQHLAQDCGDFVIWRADDWPTYHLAVVVDDGWQGVTEVVRGADLLDSTPRQCWLQSGLGLTRPSYAHLPLALDASGVKLSKDGGATPVRGTPSSQVLRDALAFLGHDVPAGLSSEPPAGLLAWARAHWNLTRVPRGSQPVPLRVGREATEAG